MSTTDPDPLTRPGEGPGEPPSMGRPAPLGPDAAPIPAAGATAAAPAPISTAHAPAPGSSGGLATAAPEHPGVAEGRTGPTGPGVAIDDPDADDGAGDELGGGRRFLRRLRGQRVALFALVCLIVLALIALLAPWLAPNDPNEQDLRNVLADPLTGDYLLGTDNLGRDVASRMIFATRIALLAAAQAVAVGLLLGVPPGLLAGYLGGWVDLVIMRVNDAVMSFPPLILAIAIVGVLGVGLTNAMIAIGIVFAPTFLRLVRSSVMEVRQETFIEASRAIGTPTLTVLRKRVVPNVLPPLLVQVSLAGGFAMLAEASLSFLGLGVQPPDASWGAMLSQAFRVLARQPWLMVWPGAAIAVTVLLFNVFGDGLRDSIGREVRKADG